MNVRLFNALFLGTLMAASGTIGAQVVHRAPVDRTPSTAGLNRMSHTCPDTTRANGLNLPDGGYLEFPNGLFAWADLRETQPGMVVAYCHYNIQVGQGVPVLRVGYRIQGQFHEKQCSASGKTVTCQR